MTEYITREAALMAVCRADLPDKTEDGVPIANGKRKVSDCVRRIKAIQAADVVEELSRKETPMKITEIHVDEYYCPACGAENNCDEGYVHDAYCPACGQRLLSEPPKEE